MYCEKFIKLQTFKKLQTDFARPGHVHTFTFTCSVQVWLLRTQTLKPHSRTELDYQIIMNSVSVCIRLMDSGLVFAPVMWIALMDQIITGDSILRSAEMISKFGYQKRFLFTDLWPIFSKWPMVVIAITDINSRQWNNLKLQRSIVYIVNPVCL